MQVRAMNCSWYMLCNDTTLVTSITVRPSTLCCRVRWLLHSAQRPNQPATARVDALCDRCNGLTCGTWAKPEAVQQLAWINVWNLG